LIYPVLRARRSDCAGASWLTVHFGALISTSAPTAGWALADGIDNRCTCRDINTLPNAVAVFFQSCPAVLNSLLSRLWSIAGLVLFLIGYAVFSLRVHHSTAFGETWLIGLDFHASWRGQTSDSGWCGCAVRQADCPAHDGGRVNDCKPFSSHLGFQRVLRWQFRQPVDTPCFPDHRAYDGDHCRRCAVRGG
jgi:hypothetical protein